MNSTCVDALRTPCSVLIGILWICLVFIGILVGVLVIKLAAAVLILLAEKLFEQPLVFLIVILIGIVVLWLVPRALIKIWKLVSASSPSRKQMFVASCTALLFDPLFLYVPFVDDSNKCLGIDKKLRVVALVLRALTDVPCLLHIIHQIFGIFRVPKVEPLYWMDGSDVQKLHHERSSKIRRISAHIGFYILAVLPIPQVMLVFYTRTPTVAYLLLQYVLRSYQIYQSCMNLPRVRRWLIGAFNFLLYILAAHVLGSFWYYNSIERETSCWQKACANIAGCRHAYFCGSNNAPNSTDIAVLLNKSCPIDPSNATVFDFGVYLDLLQSGNTGAVGFLTKYSYTYWWGIKNLSTFGTNLEPSNYIWERFFAIIISVTGLILFLYLIGNVQTYIQIETQKSLLNEEETIKKKYQDIDTWMSDNELPLRMKMEITEHLKAHKVVEKKLDDDMDICFLLPNIPTGLVHSFKEHLCMNTLKKVSTLAEMTEVALRMMCAYARPRVYRRNRYIFKKGEHLDEMIIIIKGTIRCSSAVELSSSSSLVTNQRIYRAGEFYGEQLLDWDRSNGQKLTSKEDVHCQTKVEVLVLKLRSEMKHFLDYWRERQWDSNVTPLVEMTTSRREIETILNKMETESRTKESIEDQEDEELNQKSKMWKETSEDRSLERIIQIQGDMLREQLLLVRDDMASQARRLDDISEFLAKSGYVGIPPRVAK